MGKNKKGFTLIEIMLVISLIVIVSGISIPVYQSLQVNNALDLGSNTVVQVLRRAQVLSQVGEGDSTWGVHIVSGSVTLFKGANFATRDATLDEVSEISSSIIPSGISEVVYAKVSGKPQATGVITLTNLNSDIKNITINEKGTIEY